MVRSGDDTVLTALAYLIPALALFAVLVCRRYPGERALLAVIARRRDRRRRPRLLSTVARIFPAVLLPRGGRLLGCALAVRPPPAARLALL